MTHLIVLLIGVALGILACVLDVQRRDARALHQAAARRRPLPLEDAPMPTRWQHPDLPIICVQRVVYSIEAVTPQPESLEGYVVVWCEAPTLSGGVN